MEGFFQFFPRNPNLIPLFPFKKTHLIDKESLLWYKELLLWYIESSSQNCFNGYAHRCLVILPDNLFTEKTSFTLA
jgi:hypothetical protein